MREAQAAHRRLLPRIAAEGLPVILQNAPPPAGCGFLAGRVAKSSAPSAASRTSRRRRCRAASGSPGCSRLAAGLAGVFGGAGGRYITDELARGACGTMPACELTDLHVRSSQRIGLATGRGALAVQPHAAAAEFPGGVPHGDDEGSAAPARHDHGDARARRGSALDAGDLRELDALLDELQT